MTSQTGIANVKKDKLYPQKSHCSAPNLTTTISPHLQLQMFAIHNEFMQNPVTHMRIRRTTHE